MDILFLNDERFAAPGKLAPKSYADYAFVLHMLSHLTDGGTIATILPQFYFVEGRTFVGI